MGSVLLQNPVESAKISASDLSREVQNLFELKSCQLYTPSKEGTSCNSFTQSILATFIYAMYSSCETSKIASMCDVTYASYTSELQHS